MILIADSGSTKTDWRIIDSDKKITQAKSIGINPNYIKPEAIKKIIQEGLSDYLSSPIEQIFYYGSGCGSPENQEIISNIFSGLYPDANIEVTHDMLAAARALCGHEKGIACILGTGSNSCLFDGEKITDNVRSLGYLLGDEGSGNWLGKKLLQNYFRNQLPKNIKNNFDKRFNISESEMVRALYTSESPVTYMASFSKFVFQNIKDPFLYQMVYDAFSEFIELNVMQYEGYQDLPVHFTGSVAFYFSNILRQVGADKGIAIKHIVEGPIAGLVLYHQNEI